MNTTATSSPNMVTVIERKWITPARAFYLLGGRIPPQSWLSGLFGLLWAKRATRIVYEGDTLVSGAKVLRHIFLTGVARYIDVVRHTMREEVAEDTENEAFEDDTSKQGGGHRATLLGLAARIHCGVSRKILPLERREELLVKYRDVIDKVEPLHTKRLRGVSRVGACAPVARAFFTQDHDLLQAFMDLLAEGGDGISSTTKQTLKVKKIRFTVIAKVLQFRQDLSDTKNKSKRSLDYAKTQAVLWAFLSNRSRVPPPVDCFDIFTIPGDKGYPNMRAPSLVAPGNSPKVETEDLFGWNPADGPREPSTTKVEANTAMNVRAHGHGRVDWTIVNMKDVRAFVSLWWKYFGDRNVVGHDLISIILEHDLFMEVRNRVPKRDAAIMAWIAQYFMSPWAGKQYGTEEFYWLHARLPNRSVWTLRKR